METNNLDLSVYELECCFEHLRYQLLLKTTKIFSSKTYSLRMAAQIESLTKLGLVLVRAYRRRSDHNTGLADVMFCYFDAVLKWVNTR